MTVAASAELLLEDYFEHPEGIVWEGGKGRLLWLDVFKGRVHAYDLSTGSLETVETAHVIGAIAPRRGGGLVCAVDDGFGFLSDSGEFTLVSDHLRDSAKSQMNDGAVDPRGRFWAGSMSFDYVEQPGTEALYRLDADHAVTRQLGGVSVSNGIGWSPDGRRCYYVDSAAHRIDAFDFDLDAGVLQNPQTLAEVDAMPDGLAVDVDGCVWVAMFGGHEVRRLTPAGDVDRVIRLPGAQVTTCTFGGTKLDTLFIAVSPFGLDEATARAQQAGHIFALDVGVQGLPTPYYCG